VLQIISALREVAGLADGDFEPEFAAARTGELQRSWLDVSRARAELGFTADTDLVSGLKPTLEWARAAAAG
jgi:UDP-glucose 4-epimerase